MKIKLLFFLGIISLLIFFSCTVSTNNEGSDDIEDNENNINYNFEMLNYPNSVQTVVINPNPVKSDYALFETQLKITKNNNLFWIECHPYEGNYVGGFTTNGNYNLVYNGAGEVGAFFDYAYIVNKWIVKIRENSTGPGSEILYTRIIDYTVEWQE